MRWLAILLLGAPFAQAASFDCAKAQRPVEKAICADPKLSAADSALAKAYRDDLARLSNDATEKMRADQVQWLAWVQLVCHTDDPAVDQPEMINCLQTPYAERVKLLRTAVTRQNGVSFYLRTQYLADPEEPEKFGSPEYPGFGTLQARWPVADSTDAPWIQWNHAVSARMLATGGSDDPGHKAAAEWSDDMAAGADTTVDARLKGVYGNLVTVGISVEAMGHGAAHPNEGWETFSWWLEKNRPLQADDVFATGSPWQSAVAQICWQQMSSGETKKGLYPQVKGPESGELRDVLKDTSNWTLEPDGLHISYPEYTVAPRPATPPDAVIPWAALKGLFAPGFQPPTE